MSVKNFKFVSPGVFINEIDNSAIPRSADAIGPLIIGRSAKGLAMQPVTIRSYSDFVNAFGDTVPGNGGGSRDPGDVYRYGNYQSPMYGTYAAKAFLASNVAPVTYVRLLGQQHTNATSDGYAGWNNAANLTDKSGYTDVVGGGGAYGIFIGPSSSLGVVAGSPNSTTLRLAAIIYSNSGSVKASGTFAAGAQDTAAYLVHTAAAGAVVNCQSDGTLKLVLGSSNTDSRVISVSFDDTNENFIRKKLNTNPQLAANGDFYPTGSERDYWLGETFEQTIRDNSLANSTTYVATVLGLALSGAGGISSTSATNPAYHREASKEAVAGWFIGQDTGPAGDFHPEKMQKLFRLKGRGLGEWLHKNVKVSIANIRKSNAPGVTDYGTFSIILRHINDTDNNVQVVERFDNLNLDPTSPNFIARKIGDKYEEWDTTSRLLRVYGEYPNQSNYVYVEMNPEVEAGATDAALLPFGYYGPPKMSNTTGIVGGLSSSVPNTQLASKLYVVGPELPGFAFTGGVDGKSGAGRLVSASHNTAFMDVAGHAAEAPSTFAISVDHARLRASASDGGMTKLADAYFGMQSTRAADSTISDPSVGDYHNRLYGGFPNDPTTSTITGVDSFSYIFSLDDVAKGGSGATLYGPFGAVGRAVYQSGSRAAGKGYATYSDQLDAGFNKFTAPFWGGFDGFDITKPDPVWNGGMVEGTSNEMNSSIFHTWKRAMDTISDPEYVNMNVLVAPGLVFNPLTNNMINLCEERSDSLAVIDLPNVYLPASEGEYSTRSSKASRIPKTPLQSANDLRDRRIDSSYGSTFYPWVQTRDENTGQLLWIPPSVAMMGVFGSSQARTDVWFAPAGFNRGGLTEGAAGIPIVNVTERIVSKDRDRLYEQNINPIASFPSTGLVVFGQKTLQKKRSALDRINVRRLVIYLKKQISIISNDILFEQNVEATWSRFRGLVEPFLANVKTQFGITDYKLVLDETTTTPDLIDQNIMYAKIMIKPARAIEFIAIDFVIASSGASFDD